MFGKEGPEVQGGVKEEDTFELCINWTMKERKYRLDVQMHTNMNTIFAKRGNSVRTGGMEDEMKRILAHISCRVILQQFKNLEP